MPIAHASLNLSKDIVEKAFNCLKKGQKVICTLTIEEIDEIFTVADFFGFSREKMRKLLVQKEKLCGQLDGEDQIRFELYWNSIRNLLHDDFLFVEFESVDIDDLDSESHNKSYGLKLNYDIESLEGLDLFARELPARMKDLNIEGRVAIVELSSHKLRTVDVNQILRCFPDILGLNLSNNCITTVKLPKQLPRPFILDLRNNKIKNLPVFKLGEHMEIMLQGNPLTRESRRRCLQAREPSLLERQRHRIKALTDRRVWKWGLGGIAFGISTAIATIAGFALWDKIINKINFRECLEKIYRKNLIFILGSAVGQGLWFAGVQYWFNTYNDNLIYQYRPGEILVDEEELSNDKNED